MSVVTDTKKTDVSDPPQVVSGKGATPPVQDMTGGKQPDGAKVAPQAAENSTAITITPDEVKVQTHKVENPTARMGKDAGQAGVIPTPPAVKDPASETGKPEAQLDTVAQHAPKPTMDVAFVFDPLLKSLSTVPKFGTQWEGPRTITTIFRMNAPLIEVTIDNQRATRVADQGCAGIASIGYNYPIGAPPAAGAPYNVGPGYPIFDLDARWRARASDLVSGRAVKLQLVLNEALKTKDEVTPALSNVLRIKWPYMEGSELMVLAKYYLHLVGTSDPASANVGLRGGYSALLPLVKLMGYLASMHIPCDDGGLATASAPCDSPLTWEPINFPTLEDRAGCPIPRIPAAFITLNGYREVIMGAAPGMVALGMTGDDLGRRILLVPVPQDWTLHARALVWLVISTLTYPFRDLVRTGPLSDWLNPLTINPANAALQQVWYPGPTMLEIAGCCYEFDPPAGPPAPQPAAWTPVDDSLVVLFVLTETNPLRQQNVARQLILPGAPANVVLPLQETFAAPAAGAQWADFGPALAAVVGGNPLDEVYHIQSAIQMTQTYWHSGSDVQDAAVLLATMGNFHRPAGEISGIILPARAGVSPGGGTPVPDNTPPAWMRLDAQYRNDPNNNGLVFSRPWTSLTNALCMYPSISWDVLTARTVVNSGLTHYWLPPFSQVVGLGLAIGILETGPPVIPQPVFTHTQLAMYTVVRGLELAAAVDVLFMLVKIPRQALWSNMPVPAINAAQRIRRNREVIWGKPGHATTNQGATFSSKLSARLFESRVHIEHPNNGMLYNVAQAAVGPHYRGPGYHVLSRYDVPSLAQIYPDIGVYNNEVQLDLRSFGWDVANYRYVQGAMAPDNPASNEILAPLAVENRFTNLQELVAAFKRMGPFANAAMVNMIGDPMPFYRRFKIVDSHNVGTRSYMSGDVSGPLTWASLLSYGTAEEIQAYLDYPAPQDVPLSFMHPWCGVDWRDNVELKLAITFDSPIRRTLCDARRWRIILSDTLSADPYSLMSLPGVGDRVYPDIDF